ncbi:LIM-domain binding protein [Scleroderma yunnanense]
MTQSGIKSMSLSFDGARERLSSQNCAVVECDSAVWTHNYTSGSTVTLRGPLTVHVRICPHANQTPTRSQRLAWSLKFYHFQFSSFIHEKFYTTPSPNRVLSQQRAEEEGIWENPFGIPQAALRCLEFAQNVDQMTELMAFASENNLDALSELANRLREGRRPSFVPSVDTNESGGF